MASSGIWSPSSCGFLDTDIVTRATVVVTVMTEKYVQKNNILHQLLNSQLSFAKARIAPERPKTMIICICHNDKRIASTAASVVTKQERQLQLA